MKVLDLFSGIGGFSLGLERAGMETVAFCEYDEHAQQVLKKHWPDVPIHKDIKELDANEYRGTVDVVCGGFPCQDLSTAGKQKGFSGERSSLYGEMLRIIGECRPRFAIFENVTGLLTGESGRWFAQFLYDLASIGYDAEWHCISASYIGAPHHRDRVWVIAYPCDDGQLATKERQGFQERDGSNSQRQEPAEQFKGLSSEGLFTDTKGRHELRDNRKPIERQESKSRESSSGDSISADTSGLYGYASENEENREQGRKQALYNTSSSIKDASNSDSERFKRKTKISDNFKQQVEFMRSSTNSRERFTLSEPALCGANDGVSRWMDGTGRKKLQRPERLKRLGNSVVPAIPEAIGRAIMEVSA